MEELAGNSIDDLELKSISDVQVTTDHETAPIPNWTAAEHMLNLFLNMHRLKLSPSASTGYPGLAQRYSRYFNFTNDFVKKLNSLLCLFESA